MAKKYINENFKKFLHGADYNPEQWLDNKENMKTAFEISSYTCFGIPEFIAECYSWLLEGRELPQNAQELYKKLGGPKVIFSGNF